ncbi:aldo/keto reductase [Labrys wisconsinensis]|uniref:Aryl-alcohol dehydrogenase-like predicted oxidoreductase n=1 Tax=Labrys wisconsinensis TaxID=425677 RepID=A0ABU0JEZ7_9HYPH|nr:aldo/keto reductase [Labrys wisconsinensis]MDQ0472857.1 aryl-alcohol dehydrogenase-like predicted oxidoreductase [Labrys wisconsinensis]
MTVERIDLAPGYVISRVIRGGWQLAGGHGPIERATAVEDLLAAFDAGITTFDCADIYTGVEELYGAFRRRLADARGRGALERLRIHTKLVPDLAGLTTVTRASIEAIVDQSLQRLGLERLDLVQFHWWDYAVARDLEVAGWLDGIRRAGKIDRLGGTNFDTPHVAAMVAAGIPLLSLQVQYSLLDHRPEHGLVALAARHGIALLCYGSVAGGFLGERWLGVPEPKEPFENRSLTKYKLIIDDFGGWALFQALLTTLKHIASRHGADIATVAGRAVLDRPGVAAIIVGARNRAHVAANARIGAIRLTDEDRAEIAAVLDRRRGPEGDVYTLERDRHGRHGAIMKYNLNAEAS